MEDVLKSYPHTPKSKAYLERIHLGRHEARASSIDAFALLAVRSQDEVGKILGVSRQAIQQIERIALFKVRKRLLQSINFDRSSLPW